VETRLLCVIVVKETESEDEDPEATRRYWMVKRKKEGIHKVCIMCVMQICIADICLFKLKKKVRTRRIYDSAL
jgi:hypothetical protein